MASWQEVSSRRGDGSDEQSLARVPTPQPGDLARAPRDFLLEAVRELWGDGRTTTAHGSENRGADAVVTPGGSHHGSPAVTPKVGVTPNDSLLEAFLDLTSRYATRLQQMGEVMALALDPCPRCMGRVIASDARAACTECGWTYAGDAHGVAT
jgi:hypothetical protein